MVNKRPYSTPHRLGPRRNDYAPLQSEIKSGFNFRLLISILIVATFGGFCIYAFCQLYFTPERATRNELTRIATDYYEHYWYDKVGGADVVSKYEQLPRVALKDLLLYDNERHADSRAIFDATACNTSSTSVTFVPTAPYGAQDYTINYNYDCNF